MAAARKRGSRTTGPAPAGRDEFALLAQVRAAVEKLGRGRGVVVGIGDDCAVVEASLSTRAGAAATRGRGAALKPGRGAVRPLTVLTTDSMIEGVHFRAGWLTPRELGVRAFRAAVSDVAAMGARPRFVLLSLELPGEAGGFGSREALALVRGLAADAKRSGATLVGGNVSGAARLGLTVTVLGEAVARPVLRSGARAGDLVFVTGALGGAAAGCRAMLAHATKPRAGRKQPAALGKRAVASRRPVPAAATAAYRRPPVRLDFAAGLAERGIASAMIDVSDGLLQDLGHVAERSRVAIRIDAEMVPVHRAAKLASAGATPARGKAGAASAAPARSGAAKSGAAGAATILALTGGEDYELAFTASESACDAIAKLASSCRVPVSVIGIVRKGPAGVSDLAGRPFAIAAGGFDHLRPSRAKANVRARTRR